MEAASISDSDDSAHAAENSSQVDNLPTRDYNIDFFDNEDEPLDFHPSTMAISDPAPAIPQPTPAAGILPEPVNNNRYIEEYDRPAGVPIAQGLTTFEQFRIEQQKRDLAPWAPFESQREWELARWLMTSGISQKKIDAFLALEMVRGDANPAFHNSHALLKRIDSLPSGPQWMCTSFSIKGDRKDQKGRVRTEEVELWHRNPVDCIAELLGNPAFKGKQAYAPRRVFKNDDGSNREYSEMWTADWWWEMQDKLKDGATVCPVIMSSDKTNLSRFSGDKVAWPVYLSIGNIQKSTRRKPTARAMVLVGYIPVCKLECFTKKRRSEEGYQLFHECMRRILEPLIAAGANGVEMVCADGFIRLIFAILAAYIADYPEQCLIACCKENSCPQCIVAPKSRGEYLVHSVLRDPENTLQAIDDKAKGHSSTDFVDQNLRLINPFWRDLPHCNIFSCMTPDLLHQLHKGVFKDHIVNWATQAVSGEEEEIDERFKAMSLHPELRHFKRGISLTSQWTGTEHKNMEKVFLGVLTGATDPRVLLAVRGVLDFIYYAHFETHSDESLAKLDAAWVMFHSNKEVFEKLEIRKHFNISKIHNIKHYPDSIRSRGTADGFNTKGTERLHIDLAKMGYAAGNKKEFIRQMTVWLCRQESVHQRCLYLQWAVPGYIAEVLHDEGDDNVRETADGEGGADDVDMVGETEGVAVQEVYHVAKKPAIIGASPQTITADFNAPDFIHDFNTFLATYLPTCPLAGGDNTLFSIYKRVVLQLPALAEVGDFSMVQDVIYATKGSDRIVTTKGIKHAVAAKSSTVLVRVRPAAAGQGPLDGTWIKLYSQLSYAMKSHLSAANTGLCVAQVHVIFKLPDEFGSFTCPLAYVSWFKPFRHRVPEIGMYQVSFSSRNHRRRASVIPITDIIRTCHLIPAFGSASAQDLGWTPNLVMREATSFYLNPYLRHHDFILLRYLVDTHLDEEAARQRSLEATRARGIQPRQGYVIGRR